MWSKPSSSCAPKASSTISARARTPTTARSAARSGIPRSRSAAAREEPARCCCAARSLQAVLELPITPAWLVRRGAMAKHRVLLAALSAGLFLAGCANVAPSARQPPSAGGSARAGSAAASAAAGERKLQQQRVSVARSAQRGPVIPVLVASDAGYFKNHGLDVELQVMAPPIANQGL